MPCSTSGPTGLVRRSRESDEDLARRAVRRRRVRRSRRRARRPPAAPIDAPGQDRVRRPELPRARRRGRPRAADATAALRQVRQRGHRRRRGDRPAGGHARPRPRGRARRRHRSDAPGASPRPTRWTTSPATSSSTTSAPATGRASRPRSREGEKGDGQWLRAKGSRHVPADGPGLRHRRRARPGGRAPPPQLADHRRTATEHLMQDGTTADMIWDVPS